MKCPVCNLDFQRSGGENQKDFHCVNFRCPSRTEVNYYPHLSIRDGWYFTESYNLPFKCGNKWYSVSGPEMEWKDNGFVARTVMIEINPSPAYTYSSGGISLSSTHTLSSLSGSFRGSNQTTSKVINITYFALPANSDFNEQFTILVRKLMGLIAIK